MGVDGAAAAAEDVVVVGFGCGEGGLVGLGCWWLFVHGVVVVVLIDVYLLHCGNSFTLFLQVQRYERL